MINKRSFIPITLIILVVMALVLHIAHYKLKKSRWDTIVTDLCLKEGGVKIFEYVVLSQEEYDRNDGYGNFIKIKDKSSSKLSHDYFYESKTTFIQKGSPDSAGGEPEVRKSIYTTFRRNDMKIMQTLIYFGRRGGDAPSFAHPSSFSCTRIDELKPQYNKKFYSLAQGIVKNGK